MNMLGIDQIDDLLKEYALQEREVYINNTSDAICRLGHIAGNLARAYEEKYRSDPTYKNEEIPSARKEPNHVSHRSRGKTHWPCNRGGSCVEDDRRLCR